MIGKAISHLRDKDPEIVTLLNHFKIDDLKLEKNYFKSLTRSILYQQLSGKAAKTISNRFISLYPNKSYPLPQDVLNTKHKILRSVGISNAKAHYIKNIAEAFTNDTINHKNFHALSDTEIMDQLISIKGVGPWTIQMFLMFTLNRLDVFPTGDLGVQKGFKIYFKLKELPSAKEMLLRSELWRPYRTIMSIYFWKVVDGPFDW
ncbi:DNA-3-methyladenine glycosylase [Candidatus Marinimicrobia bacterium]|jgi:DNA-3-methyladenine glycosylase II|nr:DNA-3-methyladenine glycosylase [Candidatus Neomarinimicrobiota bacterium]